MLVCRHGRFEELSPHFLPPGPGVGEEEALGGRVSVEDLGVVEGFSFAFEGYFVGFEGDGQAAEVADVFAQGQAAVDVRPVGAELGRNLGVVLGDERAGAFFEGGSVGVGPPIAHPPVGVEF